MHSCAYMLNHEPITTPESKARAAGSTGEARCIMNGGLLGTAKTSAAGKLRLALTGRALWAFAATAASLATWTGTLRAGTIYIPNGSFESPVTSYVDTRIDSWQKTPVPFWYNEATNGPWDNLVGLFLNTPLGDAQHIDNCDGNQAIWLFAYPQVGLFQDFNSTDWSNSTPTHAFNAQFEAGKSYDLTVGAIGGGGGMLSNATMQISLYYRDAASNMVTVAATTITNTLDVFSNETHLIDFRVNVPTVSASNAWAGQHIGVAIMSTVGFDLAGGYWDLDNVRLTETPVLTGSAATNGQFGFTLESTPGLRFEILASTNISLPLSNWASLGTLTNATGSISFSEPATNFPQRFYRARQLP